FLEQLRAMEEGLGRNAADVEAGSAQCLAAFGTGRPQAQLRCADRGDVTPGARPDDEDIVVVSRLSHGSLRHPGKLLRGLHAPTQSRSDRTIGSHHWIIGRSGSASGPRSLP